MSKYSKKLADEICERMARGESVNQICKDNHMPSDATVYCWAKNYKDFGEAFKEAKDNRAHVLVDQILEIADNSINDYMENIQGITVISHENIQRSKLRVDARKWVASKMLPRVYGDKTTLVGSDEDAPIQIEGISTRDRAKALASLLKKQAK